MMPELIESQSIKVKRTPLPIGFLFRFESRLAPLICPPNLKFFFRSAGVKAISLIALTSSFTVKFRLKKLVIIPRVIPADRVLKTIGPIRY